jgi:hypothetical protein
MTHSPSARYQPGRYYIGDLCYVLTEKNGYDWGEFLKATLHYVPPEAAQQGDSARYQALRESSARAHYVYRGTRFFCSSTLYGDGVYPDNFGRWYGVDAGIIGCIPLSALPHGVPEMAHGHTHTFDRSFECAPLNLLVDDEDPGEIRMGEVSVYTGDADVVTRLLENKTA